MIKWDDAHSLSLPQFEFVFCRSREEQLAQQHQEEIGALKSDHLHESQQMLTEFNKAQELLKDKISTLQIMWVYIRSILDWMMFVYRAQHKFFRQLALYGKWDSSEDCQYNLLANFFFNLLPEHAPIRQI